MAPVQAEEARQAAAQTKDLYTEYNSEEDEDFQDDGEMDDEADLSADEGARD
jgi:hypothetical protein